MGFFNGCLYFSLNNIWVFPNCTAPETENTQAAFVHIGILRFIKQCSPRLTCTGIGKFLRIPMPIVTIELNDNVALWDKRIHKELLKKKFLLQVLNFDAIKDLVSSDLKFIRRNLLLFGIYCKQPLSHIGIFVSAFNRAVSWICGGCARWRELISLTAHFTHELNLSTSLPFIRTFLRAKTRFLTAAFRNIELLAAYITGTFLSCLAFLAFRFLATLRRTKPMLLVCWLKPLTTYLARTKREPGGNTLALPRAETTTIFGSIGCAIHPLEFFSTHHARSSNYWHRPIVPDAALTFKAMVIA